MSINKHALIRYKVLDKCFRNSGKRYFLNDLIEECNKVLLDIDPLSKGISRRQIFNDIAFMESSEGWSIDLEKNKMGKKVYYRYLDTKFSINNMPLNEVEINQLRNAIDILSQFKGMPQFEWVQKLIPKLKQGASLEEFPSQIIEFDNNNYLKGIEHIGALHNAVFYKKVLSINYQPFENEVPYEIEFHPYYLKQYNNRWFIYGYFPELNKYDWNLALDRITDIKETALKFRENSEINWTEYFEDIIGVTKPTDGIVEKVVLEFYGKTGKYIESKPMHGSQKPKWLDNNTLEVKMELIINYELERFILSYADSVKVLHPESLKNTIENRLKAANRLY